MINGADAYTYDAFGNQLTSINATNPFRYCGEYYDTETGFIYLRNRYYNPSTGRFISEDPIKDGTNWYVYCGNNPINFVDPSGLEYASIRDIAESYNVAFGETPTYEFGEAYGKQFVMLSIGGYSRAFYFDGTIREPIYDENGVEVGNNWIKIADNLDGRLNLQRSSFVAAMGMVDDGIATVQTTDTYYVSNLAAILDFATYINGSVSNANELKNIYDIFGKAPTVGKSLRNMIVIGDLASAIKNGEILSEGYYRSEAVTVRVGGYKHITKTMYGVDNGTKYYQFYVKFPSYYGIPSAPEYN